MVSATIRWVAEEGKRAMPDLLTGELLSIVAQRRTSTEASPQRAEEEGGAGRSEGLPSAQGSPSASPSSHVGRGRALLLGVIALASRWNRFHSAFARGTTSGGSPISSEAEPDPQAEGPLPIHSDPPRDGGLLVRVKDGPGEGWA